MSKFDFSKLRGRIREKLKTEGAFAKSIGRSQNFISSVFNGDSFFTQTDIANAAKVLDIDDDEIGIYFFTKEVHNAEQE